MLAVLAWIVARIPIPVANVLAWGVAWLWWVLLPIRRKLAEQNVRRAFPDWGRRDVRRTLLAMMHNIVLSYVELFVFERTGQKLVVEGADRIPPGSLVVAGHAGAWDLGLLALADGIPLASFVRTPRNPWVQKTMARIRANHSLMSLETGTTLADGFAALEVGRSLLFIQDQRFNNGIVSPFFGHPCRTSPALAVAWLKTGRPVYACWQVRVGPGRHRFWARPLDLPSPTGDRAKDVQAITDACNTFYADRIREVPSGWLWLHDRWRSPDAGLRATGGP